MPEIKNSSKSDLSLVFLKWLVTTLSIIMVLGFLFLITILGIKIFGINTTSELPDKTLNGDILLPQGQIESIDVKSNILTVVVKTEAQQIKVLVINLKDRVLLYEYSIRTKDDFTVSD